MPSQIKVDEIKNVAGQYKIKTNVLEGQTTAGSITVQGEGTATTNLQQGLAKYFINYAQGTDTVNKSLNSSTVTDASLGHFTLNYTNNFSDALYSLSTGIHDNTDDADTARGGHSLGFENGGTVNTASAQCNYCYGASNSAAAVDLDATNSFILYGDLA
tara:strand:+ start:625 stop:1101 length:477 start_codon:yes stop_codon:yes gene_type:complete